MFVFVCGRKLVKETLAEIRQRNQQHSKPFLEIHLEGLVHTNDQTAMREICRQLTMEQEMEGKTFVSIYHIAKGMLWSY